MPVYQNNEDTGLGSDRHKNTLSAAEVEQTKSQALNPPDLKEPEEVLYYHPK